MGNSGQKPAESREEIIVRDRRLAERYIPRLRFDRAEPYSPEGVGYTIYTAGDARRADAVQETAVRSRSCRLQIEMEPGETVIEYAFYYDFDIQHLYDLEHVFVKVDREGGITGILGSFHGKFLNNLIEDETEFEGTHIILYVQPGKHAFMPKPHYFRLFPDRDRCCGEYAGRDGLLIAPMFEGRLFTDEAFDGKVERYIRENHAFVPTWEFTARYPDPQPAREPGLQMTQDRKLQRGYDMHAVSGVRRAEDLLMPWEELDVLIVERITEWKDKIERAAQRL